MSECARGQLRNVKSVSARRSKILQHLIPRRISHVERQLFRTLARNCRSTKTGHHYRPRRSRPLSLRIVSSRSASSRNHRSTRSSHGTRNRSHRHRLRTSLLRPLRLLLRRQHGLILVIPLLRKGCPLLLRGIETQRGRCLATLSRQGFQLLLLLVRQTQIRSHSSIRKCTNTSLTDIYGSQQLELSTVQQSQCLARYTFLRSGHCSLHLLTNFRASRLVLLLLHTLQKGIENFTTRISRCRDLGQLRLLSF